MLVKKFLIALVVFTVIGCGSPENDNEGNENSTLNAEATGLEGHWQSNGVIDSNGVDHPAAVFDPTIMEFENGQNRHFFQGWTTTLPGGSNPESGWSTPQPYTLEENILTIEGVKWELTSVDAKKLTLTSLADNLNPSTSYLFKRISKQEAEQFVEQNRLR